MSGPGDSPVEDRGSVAERVPQPELRAALKERPQAFGFFQAVRLLQSLSPGRRPVGMFGDPEDEVVHFEANEEIAFPASEIQDLDMRAGSPHKMKVNFMGLTGPQGVLPLHYSALVKNRMRERDTALKAFLDIFHNRLVALFYRAWEKSHFVVAFERNRRDRMTHHLLDLLGLGNSSVQNRLPVKDEALLLYAGLLSRQQRGAVALRSMLEDHFRVPVEVEQFVGGWHPVSRDQQATVSDDGMSLSGQLGIGTVVGDELWDPQSRVRIKLGPLSRAQFDDFLPTGTAHERIRTLTRFFGDDQFDFEVQLILDPNEVPAVVLGDDTAPAAPLGWGTWIRSNPYAGRADETTFSL